MFDIKEPWDQNIGKKTYAKMTIAATMISCSKQGMNFQNRKRPMKRVDTIPSTSSLRQMF